MVKELKFGLTAFDPNPMDVVLNMNQESCDIISVSGNTKIAVEDYRSAVFLIIRGTSHAPNSLINGPNPVFSGNFKLM